MSYIQQKDIFIFVYFSRSNITGLTGRLKKRKAFTPNHHRQIPAQSREVVYLK